MMLSKRRSVIIIILASFSILTMILTFHGLYEIGIDVQLIDIVDHVEQLNVQRSGNQTVIKPVNQITIDQPGDKQSGAAVHHVDIVQKSGDIVRHSSDHVDQLMVKSADQVNEDDDEQSVAAAHYLDIVDLKQPVMQPLGKPNEDDDIRTKSSRKLCDVTYDTKYDKGAGARAIQTYRQLRVRHVCERELKKTPLNLTRDPEKAFEVLRYKISNSYANDDFKMIATYHKIAYSGWREVFANLYTKSSLAFRQSHDKYHSALVPLELDGHISPWIPAATITKKLTDYTNFLFVCHPLCRLIDSYKDSFSDIDPDYRKSRYYRIARLVAKEYNAAASEEKGAPTITFIEFLRFLIDDKLFARENKDLYWNPIYLMQKPCDHYYDFIGHMDTLKDDIEYLFKLLQIEKVVRFPFKHPTMNCSREIFEEYFSPVADDLFQDIVRKFEYDLKIFGYHVPCDVKDMLENM
ncbi:carbohydrate sulfotransferase 14-like [Amphiura filiformis]|uniref:carbohydrate sulfotransferase 14-like n=1 Tax=Amphiura filiformis TaxID=82378 RepID=UPI003B21242B